jgi:hypothetical protein
VRGVLLGLTYQPFLCAFGGAAASCGTRESWLARGHQSRVAVFYAALAAQPVYLQQVGAGKHGTYAGPAQPTDRLPV